MTYRYTLLLLDFVRRVKDMQTLKYYVSEAVCASVFREEAPNLLDPLDQAIFTETLTSVSKLLRTELVRGL